jgi:hypothetical protein
MMRMGAVDGINIHLLYYKESSGIHDHQRSENKKARHMSLSLRSREAGNISGTNFMQDITKIGTQRVMKTT